MSKRIIEADRSIIVSPDVEPENFETLVQSIGHVAGLSAYKVGFELGLGMSLGLAVDMVKENNPHTKVIYDHQKAGNDIDDTGKNFARTMQYADVDAAILFPFTGPVVEEAWVKALQDVEISVIVGAEMTHKKIRASEGGYIADDAFMRMFEQAVDLGVRDFVVPGNKPDRVREYRTLFDSELGEGHYDLYSPGLVAQGGTITEGGEAAGKRWHGIIGRGIFAAEDPRAAAIEYAQQITGEVA